jgi:enoyl-CoA hydratase
MSEVGAAVTELPEFRNLRIEARDGIAVVALDRPPVNAANQDLYRDVRTFFSRIDELLPEVRVVILRGEGPHFSAGNDLHEFQILTPQNAPGLSKLVRESFAAIYDCPVPVIGAIHGVAVGSGLAIAACCDALVCGESAKLGTPEVAVGVMGGAKHMRRLVPEQVMRILYFTAEPVPAAELVPYGGIYKVVPDEELMDAAFALADRMAVHSRAALRHAKEALNTIEFMDLKGGYEAEQRFTTRLSDHPDSREAREAVLSKRTPEYSHS